MTAQTVCSRHQAAAWRRMEGEMILLQPEEQKLCGLNPTGARVWDLVDGARSAGDIAGAIASEFGREATEVLGDVLAFLGELERRQLVVVVA
jgi:hypothetical protein